MTILITLAVITGLLLWYALQGRDWLKSKPWAQGFFAAIEPVEIVLFRKSQTILFARLQVLGGLLLTFLTQLGSIDLSPLLPFIPEKYRPIADVAVNMLPMALTFMGMASERLRNTSTKPIELVEIPDKVVAENSAVAAVVADADSAKVNAVAVVAAEAKAA